jgi:tripartite-type tricarboxylate transporter receptor subunit TctC
MMMKYLLTVLLILTAHAVGAETYSVPTNLAGKTLQIIVPVTVGSTTDIVARVFAKTITEQVGDQMKVITMNRPGASGNIAIQSVVSSEPQSLTVCFCDNSTVIANPLLKMPNSIEFSDINIVSSIAEGYLILIAPGNAPYNTLPELIEYMKQNPKHNIIGAATATPALTAREIIDRGGLKDTEVIQYKGGSEAMLAVSRGDVPVAVTGIGDTAELVKAGKLKYIAVGSDRRLSILADVPTIAETFPGVSARTTFGVYASSAMPKDIQQSLNVVWTNSLKNKNITDMLVGQGRVILGGDLGTSQENFVKHISMFKTLADNYGRYLK